MNSSDPTLSFRPTKVEVPKELPKVSMVNTSLKKLKYHLAGFDVVVKERTMATAITEGSWGFEHTKACFRDEIILFVKALKDLFNTFDLYLINELSEVQNVFHQMEQAVEQHRFESQTFKVKMNQVLNENERLLDQVINKDIVNIIMNSSMDNASVNTYKQLYDSIKPTHIRSKEQCDDLINQVNLKSVEIYDLNASLQEKVLVITTLKDELTKLKGKVLADNVVCKHTIDPEMLKIDVEYLNPRLLNNRSAHSDYLKHTQEEAAILRKIELLVIVKQTCPNINNSCDKLVAVIPTNKDKRVRFNEPVTSSRNTNTETTSSSNLVSNKPMLSSIGVKTSISASGSQPSGNTKKYKIQRTPRTANVHHSKLNANSEPLCVKCNGCMLSGNHDLCVLDFINDVNARTKSKYVKKSSKRKVWKPIGKVFTNIGYTWRPTGRTFTIVGNGCPLTKITTTTEVPLRKPTALESDTPKRV
ncbi:hypothetical protein Tco_0300689 [Tanacetum coccineum]